MKKQVFFDYQVPEATSCLQFEALSYQNYARIYDLFKDDASPFIPSRFKNQDELLLYAVFVLEKLRYSQSRGGYDLFFKNLAGEYMGILHCYDWVWDEEKGQLPHCTLGFNTAEAYRGQGFSRAAVEALIHHLFAQQGMQSIQAYTVHHNIAAQHFLHALGFKPRPRKDSEPEKYSYFQIKKNRNKHQAYSDRY